MTDNQYLVDFQPVGRRIRVPAGTDLLSAARQTGVDLAAVCSGLGICGSCKVRLVSGELSPLTAAEEDLLDARQIEQGVRLACQAVPLSDVRLELLSGSLPEGQRLQVEGETAGIELHPAISVMELGIDPTKLNTDLHTDFMRVMDEINAGSHADAYAGCGEPEAKLAALTQLSETLREQKGHVKLVLGSEGQPISAGFKHWLAGTFAPQDRLLGLAVDLGSTKLAFYLIDLETGITATRTGVMNPQIAYGEDVVSRIAFANRSEENHRLLQTRLVDIINQTAAGLCGQAGASTQQIVDAVLVGNTAMHHFVCGLPVYQLGAAPYLPSVREPLCFPAAEIGLKFAPGAHVYLPANIAGYVGADHTAALLSSGITNGQGSSVLVDIGTNTEISLVHGGRVYSCSTASGPAFEGAHIRDGMRAAPGAIDRMHILPDGVHVSTIQGAPAAGICGSGILQAVAAMLDAGLLDERGRFNRRDPRMRIADIKAEFVLVPTEQSASGRDIAVTRKDVNEIRLAKGAIRSGIDILLETAGLQAGQVDHWVIAGAFGTWLDLGSAVRIGMFPDVPLERFAQVGNAAGMGARQMLLDARTRGDSARIAGGVEYVELTVYPGFTDVFVKNMGFPDQYA